MDQLVFTAFLNRLFGPAVLSLLQALHIHPQHPNHPITNSFAMELLVLLLLTIFFIAVRSRLSVESPGGLQHTMEAIQGTVHGIASEVIANHPEKFVPYLTVLGLFILSCNLLGLVPGLESPTAVPIVPLGCALFTWFYYHYQGVRANGPLGYLMHFMGPQEGMPFTVRLLLPFLLFPIEIIQPCGSRPFTDRSSFRQHVRGRNGDACIFSLIPLGIPIVFEVLHIGVSLIQTYIFVLLPCVYLGEAIAHEH